MHIELVTTPDGAQYAVVTDNRDPRPIIFVPAYEIDNLFAIWTEQKRLVAEKRQQQEQAISQALDGALKLGKGKGR
jgi:hypothetical protein